MTMNCGPGEHWDDSIGDCVPDHGGTGAGGQGHGGQGGTRCPPNQKWSTIEKRCIEHTEPEPTGDEKSSCSQEQTDAGCYSVGSSVGNETCFCPDDKDDDTGGGGRGDGDGSGGGAGGGGGGGGGGRGNTEEDEWDPQIPEEIDVWKWIKGMMSGENSPFNDATVERMKASLFRSVQGRASASEDAIRRDAVRRGQMGAGFTGDAMAGVQRGALSEWGQGVTNIMVNKAKADLQQRMAALQASLGWLDHRRSWLLGKRADATARTIGEAQIQLGYAQVNAELKIARMQMAAMGGGGGGSSDADADLLSSLLS